MDSADGIVVYLTPDTGSNGDQEQLVNHELYQLNLFLALLFLLISAWVGYCYDRKKSIEDRL